MVGFLGYFHHFPCCCKDGFIPLLLPKLNVKGTVGKAALD